MGTRRRIATIRWTRTSPLPNLRRHASSCQSSASSPSWLCDTDLIRGSSEESEAAFHNDDEMDQTNRRRLRAGLVEHGYHGIQQPRTSKRWVLLDITRAACVFCVVSEHSGGPVYSEHDAGFVTHWVLQWLFVVSGVSFMMSRSPCYVYFLPYLLVFVCGLTCNVVADDCAPTMVQ